MDGQDWAPVVLRSRGGGGGGGGGAARGGGGPVAVERKHSPLNASAHAGSATAGHLRKLEEDTEHFAHATVGLELSRAIQQARLAKKLTQKDLAALIAEKSTVINDYEAGRAIPNGNIISKLESALGTRLPRPPKKK